LSEKRSGYAKGVAELRHESGKTRMAKHHPIVDIKTKYMQRQCAKECDVNG
jgi:hypothetical protein